MEQDPIYKEYKFCINCMPKTHDLIKYIRSLENAQIVAKQAIESIDSINRKLSDKNRKLEDQVKELKVKVVEIKDNNMKRKMNELDAAHQRFVNRKNLC